MTNALMYLGQNYTYEGKYVEALNYIRQALPYASKSDKRNAVSWCYNGIGMAYYYLGDLVAASDYYFKALQMLRMQEVNAAELKVLLNQQVKNTYAVEPVITRLEKEILQRIAADLTSQQIADKLFLSKRTIDNYRLSLLMKLGAKNPAELIKKAIQLGLID